VPIPIPTPLIEFILLGPMDDRRQLQDSPILGDVWVDFGKKPEQRIDLLIAPYRGQHAGGVADILDKELHPDPESENDTDDTRIAFLQGLIAARLTFRELIRYVAPKTKWWKSKSTKDEPPKPSSGGPQTNIAAVRQVLNYPGDLKKVLENILNEAIKWQRKTGKLEIQNVSSLDRFLALTALILWAGSHTSTKTSGILSSDEQIKEVLNEAQANVDQVVQSLRDLAADMQADQAKKPYSDDPLVYQVSLNRIAMPAISRSIPAVKADAATTLFKVNCSEISWAVIDSGIDGDHPALRDKNGQSRVKQSFDFKNYRRIVSLSNSRRVIREKNIDALLEDNDNLKRKLRTDDPVETQKLREEAHKDLERLAEDARSRGPIHWELVTKYVEIKPGTRPATNHGTHVAGIIGASREAALKVAADEAANTARANAEQVARNAESSAEEGTAAEGPSEEELAKLAENARERVIAKPSPDISDGMCPDITLYDFRVLGPSIEDAEFAIIAALQFIRYLNDQDIFLTIHGANLSLSIPHDVRNFACGRTPICDECEQLVSSGVVVVAAAGNHGYKSFETKDGFYDSYAAFSITDPGNADRVLTVGATHRFWPHTYGVSFFSSRGPTGDGRAKPDLVAPGEKIRAPIPGNHEVGGNWGDLDGTSMAAPHVSGAAAMLMARYQELIGQPDRIKQILCQSATDLGRERSFQGNGMLDVLRAFQSI
jgi:serine protease AprX